MGLCAIFSVVVLAILLGAAFQLHRTLNSPAPLPPFDAKAYWGAGSVSAYKESTKITPFKVAFAGDELEQLRAELRRDVPLTPALEGTNFDYGINAATLHELVRHWRDDYLARWPERQTFLNKYPQFHTQIQGLNVHYLHVKPTPQQSAGKRVVPLLLLHGWPGSVREFYEIIELLVAPDALKGDVVFEVVAPSLPGYGWSQASAKTGFGPAELSVVMRNLMLRLGHQRFVIQGGDWGSIVGSAIATIHSENVIGYHSNMCFSNSALATLKSFLGSYYPSAVVPEEFVDFYYPLGKKYDALLTESGYFHIQATKPDTIGHVLTGNPIGLLGYIFEKFSTWTNPAFKNLPQGGWERFPAAYKDAILDNIMIYYISNSITTSQRLYSEAFTYKQMAHKLDQVPTTVPVACARFKNDLAHTADWQLSNKYLNLVQSTHHTDGGHFAAMEKAPLLYRDFVDFAKKVL